MISNRLRDPDWTEVINYNDVNTAYSTFHKIFNFCYPIIRKNANCKSNHKLQLTPGLVNACKKEKALYNVFLKYRSNEAETKNKVYKNKLIAILRFSEKLNYGNQLVEYKNNFKGTWQLPY